MLNIVRKEPFHLQRYLDSPQLDHDIFDLSEELLPALMYVPQLAATELHRSDHWRDWEGMELIARAIHSLSYRSSRAFVRVHGATIPPRTAYLLLSHVPWVSSKEAKFEYVRFSATP